VIAKGVIEVLFEGVNVGDKDFSAVVSKVRRRAPTFCIGG
jgi:hypothetical protein